MTSVASGKSAMAVGKPQKWPRREAEQAIEQGRRLYESLGVIDWVSYESLTPEAAVSFMIHGAMAHLSRLMVVSIQTVRTLQGAICGHRAGGARGMAGDESGDRPAAAPSPGKVDGWYEVGETAVEGLSSDSDDRLLWAIDEILSRLSAPAAPRQPVEPRALATQFQLVLDETEGRLADLQQAGRRRSKWELISTGEMGKRWTRKMLQWSLTVAVRVMDSEESEICFAESATELQSALRSRETLRQLCRTTANVIDDPAVDVMPRGAGRAVRVLRCLQEVFADPSYADVRVVDRCCLRGLERSLKDSIAAGDALATLAKVREELAALGCWRHPALEVHDRRLRQACLEDLADLSSDLRRGGALMENRLVAVCEEVSQLAGEESTLAHVVGEMRRGPGRNRTRLVNHLGQLMTLISGLPVT